MKKKVIFIMCILVLLFTVVNLNAISDYLADYFSSSNEVTLATTGEYAYDYEFYFVQNTTDFTPLGTQDIMNIFYTLINNRVSTFTFYCPSEYSDCINEVDEISTNTNLLAHINNYVHPFNSFKSIKTEYSDSGEVKLSITYLYTEEEIDAINSEVDSILVSLDSDITSADSDYDKIKIIHDYIINNTKYDVDATGYSENKSYIAYGALFNHVATCNGYTDLMAIFLTKMGYTNFKIATPSDADDDSGHIWNAVLIDGSWLHLDLTWDDPVSSDGSDYLYHKYFLIDDEALVEADKDITSTEHVYDKTIYLEFKLG